MKTIFVHREIGQPFNNPRDYKLNPFDSSIAFKN